jgi:hypothetical protein
LNFKGFQLVVDIDLGLAPDLLVDDVRVDDGQRVAICQRRHREMYFLSDHALCVPSA